MIEVKIPTSSPFTLMGLCCYLGVNTHYLIDFENSLKERLKDKDDVEARGYYDVITHVREVIYVQKFEGAVVGAYNANIISRELGLAEKKDLNEDQEMPSFSVTINAVDARVSRDDEPDSE